MSWFENVQPAESIPEELLDDVERAVAPLAPTLEDGARALVRMVGLHDAATAEHMLVVGDFAERLAVGLGLSPREIRDARFAGMLHDVGKIAVGAEILRKPMQLTPTEWNEVRRHPSHGAAVLRGIAALESLAEIVHAHHERVDGEGYPDRRRSHEIPRLSRVIAIVDAFDAMTRPRPYTRVRTHKEACAELQRCAGTQFDPEFVTAFLTLLRYR